MSGINLASLTFYIANATGYRSATAEISINVSPVNLAPWWTTTLIIQQTSAGPKDYEIFNNGSIGRVYWDLPLLFTFQVFDLDPFLMPFTFNISLSPFNLLSPGKTSISLPGATGSSGNLAYFYSGRNGIGSIYQNSQIAFYANGMITNSAIFDKTIRIVMGSNTTLGIPQTLQLVVCDNNSTIPYLVR